MNHIFIWMASITGGIVTIGAFLKAMSFVFGKAEDGVVFIREVLKKQNALSELLIAQMRRNGGGSLVDKVDAAAKDSKTAVHQNEEIIEKFKGFETRFADVDRKMEIILFHIPAIREKIQAGSSGFSADSGKIDGEDGTRNLDSSL